MKAITINQNDLSQFASLFSGTGVNVSDYLDFHGVNKEGKLLAEFTIPKSVLPVEKLNASAFRKFNCKIQRGAVITDIQSEIRDKNFPIFTYCLIATAE